jgi:hypothetical protein
MIISFSLMARSLPMLRVLQAVCLPSEVWQSLSPQALQELLSPVAYKMADSAWACDTHGIQYGRRTSHSLPLCTGSLVLVTSLFASPDHFLWLCDLPLLRLEGLQHLSLCAERKPGQFSTVTVIPALLAVVMAAVSIKAAAVSQSERRESVHKAKEEEKEDVLFHPRPLEKLFREIHNPMER